MENAGEYMKDGASSAWSGLKGLVGKKSELESKLEECLSNKNWGASSTILGAVAKATYNHQEYPVVMDAVWRALGAKAFKWRLVFKGLTLLEFLLKHGTERVIDDARDHMFQMRTLTTFAFRDGSSGDKGQGVRQKAKDLLTLLKDNKRIRKERKEAQKMRSRFQGTAASSSDFSRYKGSGGGGGNLGGFGNSGDGFRSGSRYGGKGGYDDNGDDSDDKDESDKSSDECDKSEEEEEEEDSESEEEVKPKKRSTKAKKSGKLQIRMKAPAKSKSVKKKPTKKRPTKKAPAKKKPTKKTSKKTAQDDDWADFGDTGGGDAGGDDDWGAIAGSTGGDDFGSFSAAPPQAPVQAAPTPVQQDLFGNFSAPATTATPAEDDFGGFSSGPPPAQDDFGGFSSGPAPAQGGFGSFSSGPMPAQGGFGMNSAPTPAPKQQTMWDGVDGGLISLDGLKISSNDPKPAPAWTGHAARKPASPRGKSSSMGLGSVPQPLRPGAMPVTNYGNSMPLGDAFAGLGARPQMMGARPQPMGARPQPMGARSMYNNAAMGMQQQRMMGMQQRGMGMQMGMQQGMMQQQGYGQQMGMRGNGGYPQQQQTGLW